MIVTDRLKLRRPQITDLADIHNVFCDDEVMTYWASSAHLSLADTEAWLRPIIDDPDGSRFDYFIEFKGNIIGKLGCWKVPELGFILRKAYWGQGLATEGLRAFIVHMKASAVCDHLFADIDPRNERSKRLLETCGFRLIGHEKNTIKTHLGWCDSDYFRLDL
jgi:ribosomal-protein-alanine N-acetyltransferase